MPPSIHSFPRIPAAPRSIEKGIPLKNILDFEAIDCLANNILLVHQQFDKATFCDVALNGLEPLGIMERGVHIASALQSCLPSKFSDAAEILVRSLTPPNRETEGLGLAVFFYHPHACFIAEYGHEASLNDGDDPFEISMSAQYELTRRFTAEFSIRSFLIRDQERTLSQLMMWTTDADPHVRRLCSEGSRPRLPWAQRIPTFIAEPTHTLPILEALKNDEHLYVRRSVANHLGDIAKSHPETVFALCERWLEGASKDLKWLIRHALRHPAKQGNEIARQLRVAAK